LSRLRSDYIETGKIRFVYKHFAILGPDSVQAAEASECAAEQGNFWEYHDRIFAKMEEGNRDLSAETLVAEAGKLGLDTPSFNDCLTSGRYTNQIRQESLSVQSMGVRGTPAFLVNGVFISGAQPYEVFQQVIEEQLAALEKPSN
jgi:protein-disulfide isomerase